MCQSVNLPKADSVITLQYYSTFSYTQGMTASGEWGHMLRTSVLGVLKMLQKFKGTLTILTLCCTDFSLMSVLYSRWRPARVVAAAASVPQQPLTFSSAVYGPDWLTPDIQVNILYIYYWNLDTNA